MSNKINAIDEFIILEEAKLLVDCVEVLRAVNKNIEKRIKNSDKETKEKFAFIWDFEKDQAKPDEFSEYIIKRISKIIDEGDDLDV